MDLRQLTQMHAVSGDERGLRLAIMEAAKKHCQDVKVDRCGNVVCHKPGKRSDLPGVLMAAHMDEVGFIVVGHTEDGLLRFSPVGGIDPRVVVSKWVELGPDRLKGVIGAMAIHLQTPEDRQRVLDFKNLYIDIGAKDQKEAEKLCPLGTYAAFDTPYEEFGDGLVCAKALDDRIGCYNLLRLLKEEHEQSLTACFVTQEEVGLRGSQGSAYTQNAPVAVVLEGTTANDLGDVPERFQVCRVRAGVAVSFMDGASIGDRELFRQMLQLAEEAEIPHQVKQGVSGGNDAGSYQRACEGARTMVLSVPCRYIHSGASVASHADIEAQYQLAREFLNNI